MSRKTEILALLATLCTGVAYAQAHVYVQTSTSAPIYAFNSSSTGKLIPITGSPFKGTTGLLVGTNGTHLITMGTTYMHSYKVSSTGAVGAQVSQINTKLYDSLCDGIPTSVYDDPGTPATWMDRTGQYLYLTRTGYSVSSPTCAMIQTFEVSSTGLLTFKGALIGVPTTGPTPGTAALSGNGKFAILIGSSDQSSMFTVVARESTGVLLNTSFSETDPTAAPGSAYLMGFEISPDQANHFAVPMIVNDASAFQLASYTLSDQGNLVSTNTWENMPATATFAYLMRLNPAGNILAVGQLPGVQFFHFNGAAPITTFTGIVGTSGEISGMAWDKYNHLYALNNASGKLHVYTATTTSVKEALGSPYSNVPFCSGCWPTIVVH
jgi:hypothetical protein